MSARRDVAFQDFGFTVLQAIVAVLAHNVLLPRHTRFDPVASLCDRTEGFNIPASRADAPVRSISRPAAPRLIASSCAKIFHRARRSGARTLVDLGGADRIGPFDQGPVLSRAGRRFRARCATSDLPVGRSGDDGVQPHLQKYFCFSETQIRCKTTSVPPHKGAYHDRRETRGGMRWTRTRQDERC